MNAADPAWIIYGLIALYAIAIACIYQILLSYRTAQGAIAWILALLAVPYLAVPWFLLFGRNRFGGYLHARRPGEETVAGAITRFESQNHLIDRPGQSRDSDELQVLSRLGRQSFTRGNRCDLLRDGTATFDALFEAMEDARHYILLEFYIVRSDKIGQRIKSILKRKLAQGVEVWFLYDDIGSVLLPRKYLRELAAAGAHVASFGDGNLRRMKLQVNFRNHRKLLVCDGNVGFVGGINLGDEYLGAPGDEEPWRDTHCRIRGPAAQGLQLAWLEDWNWASEDMPELDWKAPATADEDEEVLILPMGPADTYETGALFFLNCINNARDRIWIASPYFVPDFQILNALQLAALRGVDVRVIIPQKTDSWLIGLAAYSYLVQASQAGISIYRYQRGFMHQKTVLVDDRYAAVGTANLDNRSMRLNFEIMAINTARAFVERMEQMLTADMENCRLMTEQDYRDRSILFRLACRATRLAGPLL
jgi:cardiolipin synthase A/B